MDSNDGRQRQNGLGYTGQQGSLQRQHQYPGATSAFRQQPPLTSTGQPTSSGTPASRANSQAQGYAYDHGSQYVGSGIQPSYGSYQPPYSTQQYSPEQQPQRGSQYQQYGQNFPYNVHGQQAAGAAAPTYEGAPTYQQTRPSAIDVLNTGFAGVPQPQQQYYSGAPAAALAAQSVPSQYPPLGYTAQQAQVGPDPLAHSYPPVSMADQHLVPTQGAYGQAPQAAQDDQSAQQTDPFQNYNNELKKAYENIVEGQLFEASTHVTACTDWLLTYAEILGLCRDDETARASRLQLWGDFNTCWLMMLQKQKDTMEQVRRTGQMPPPPQNLIGADEIKNLGNKLTKHSDSLEKHGLVDYAQGVREEEIVAMLEACLDLWEELHDGPSPSSGGASTLPRRNKT